MKVLFAGDFCETGRFTELLLKNEIHFVSEEMKAIISQNDFSVVNFEFPVVVSEAQPIPKIGPNLRGHKESVDALKYAGFNVCTLANNHILDQGEKCCIDTKRLLNEAGFYTVGAGKDIIDASEILYLYKGNETMAIINCCEHEFTIATESRAGANPLNPIKQYYQIQEARSKADYIVVIVHGGHEYYQLPSPRMQETYRFFIDSGADLVVNHHQHCYSGYEEYKDKYIFYGLGNFFFDNSSKRNGDWNEGFLLSVDFVSKGKPNVELLPYNQCNQNLYVELMKEENYKLFFDKISELNYVIANEQELRKRYNFWMENNCKSIPVLFEPWQGKYTSALYWHGLLPTTFRGTKRLKLSNYIWCESHLERLRFVFKDT